MNALKMNRRRFLGVSGGALAAATFGSGLGQLRAAGEKEDLSKFQAKGNRKYIPSNCAMCVNKCGIICEVVDGKLHKINPNPEHIKSRGMLCAKGNAGASLPYSPDRLKKPLLRTGKRGEGKWKEISWEEAYKHLAQNLAKLKQKYKNRSSVAFASTEGLQEEFFYYLVSGFGSLNTVRHPTLCLSTNIQGWSSVYGVYPDADLQNAEFVVMIGSDRAQSFITPDSVDFQRFKPKGQQLIYLDPRFTETAAKADKWFPVKPRTDMAFTLAMIQVIIQEKLYNQEFIETHVHGFEQFGDHILKNEYTPEWAETKCEIPAEEIRWTARQFAAHAPKSVIYPGRRSSFYAHEVYFRQTCAILTAICGCWDVRGGIVPKSSVPLSSHTPLFPFFYDVKDRVDKEAVGIVKKVVPSVVDCPLVGTGLPEDSCAFLSERDGSWITFREAVLHDEPYPVRGFICFKQNPLQSVPNTAKTLQMMEKMEFICVIEQQMSDTAWYADLVLPHSTYLESWDPCHALSGIWPVVVARQPVIDPLFKTRTMFEISGGILKEMLKIPELWDDVEPEAVEDFKKTVLEEILEKPIQKYMEHQLSEYPGGYERILKKGVLVPSQKPNYGKTRQNGFRFKTKTGKIELFNERFHERGLDAMPAYCEPLRPQKEGEYRFLVGRTAWHTHSSTQNIPHLWEIMKENAVWINTAEAAKLGIKDGEYCQVKSKVGQQTLKAYVTEKIRPDAVYYVNGWGRLSPGMSLVYKKGGSEAEILEDTMDSISGSAAMHETYVTIEKT
ncbi:MAG: molybdopterin-dependent oxidoreductase [Desulfohalobiaceae bacterium]|nr:molybdopterin-dependent oxidoreductase [Desulfohalobiaceae bacterium]